MGKSLYEIAKQINGNNKKVQLIYAFNGTGKTRLSREFKSLVESENDTGSEEIELENKKILYYNAFTEDLFYWDNDLSNDVSPKMKIHPNSFTNWIFNVQGQDNNITEHFQHYTDEKLTPKFNFQDKEKYNSHPNIDEPLSCGEITFSYNRGNDKSSGDIKISKGEESCLIWSIFYFLIEQVVEVLNTLDPIDRETNQFDNLKYVFVDDPVSSLDDNHLIQLAVDLAQLIRKSESNLKFVITTHNPLFYNVLYNELGAKLGYMLIKNEDGSYVLDDKWGDSNKNFSYHHYLISTLKQAIADNKIEKYHFILLRNLYEKTANFLGYKKWSELLPGDKKLYSTRIMNFYSHRTLLNEEIRQPTEPEKEMVQLLLNHLIDHSKFWKEAEDA